MLEQRAKPGPEPLTPNPRRPDRRFVRDRPSARDGVLEDRQEAVLAIAEQVIERAPRNTRPRHNPRDGDRAHTMLGHHTSHRRENPRALNLTDPHRPLPRHGTQALSSTTRTPITRSGGTNPRTSPAHCYFPFPLLLPFTTPY